MICLKEENDRILWLLRPVHTNEHSSTGTAHNWTNSMGTDCIDLEQSNLDSTQRDLIDMSGKHTDEKTIQAIIDVHKAGISNKEIAFNVLCRSSYKNSKLSGAKFYHSHKNHLVGHVRYLRGHKHFSGGS
ncbi:hypothetical protein E2C01_055774 [Portunus trituberculatus]|uniref:Uncharacterized protein n=1 Tax=Portunus trituberculatus TaxID=210409 RepID=A0A5B7GVY2_PORTR|nr:hypothetical protein [Portunus trituberculatus]